MVDIQTIAALLLIGRSISIIFICLVINKQARLFGKSIDFEMVPNLTTMQKKNVYRIRRVLFTLSIIKNTIFYLITIWSLSQ